MIEHSVAFAGEITGLSGTNAFDLGDISFGGATRSLSDDAANGVLTVTDGAQTASINLGGNYRRGRYLATAMVGQHR